MRSAFALRIISGKIIYNFGIPERLRTLRYSIFTGRVWNELPQSKPDGFASSPKGRAKSTAGSFLIMPNTLATNVTAWLSL